MSNPHRELNEAEATKLRELKPRVPRCSRFGDDNHAVIDASLKVLEQHLSAEEIYEREDWTLLQHEMAEDARLWMDGVVDKSPSESWKPLVQ